MTIKEVCDRYDITPDTLRYYEKVGVIPKVHRTQGGIRDYTEQDLKWVENAICMRSAGVPIDLLIEYVRLFQEGDDTFKARRDILVQARVDVQAKLDQYQATMEKLNYKIAKYEKAMQTGVLSWDDENIDDCTCSKNTQ